MQINELRSVHTIFSDKILTSVVPMPQLWKEQRTNNTYQYVNVISLNVSILGLRSRLNKWQFIYNFIFPSLMRWHLLSLPSKYRQANNLRSMSLKHYLIAIESLPKTCLCEIIGWCKTNKMRFGNWHFIDVNIRPQDQPSEYLSLKSSIIS